MQFTDYAIIVAATQTLMNDAITPTNITAAALVMQILLVSIIYIGIRILMAQNRELSSRSLRWHLGWMVTLTLVTVALLLFSDSLAGVWKPLFGQTYFPLVGSSRALLWVLLIDIGCTAWIVLQTGGSHRSPFTTIYFMLPPIAIFLREHTGRVIVYTFLVAFLFSVGMEEQPSEEMNVKAAYWFVSVASFCLTTFIGFITRPH